jgi:hypothetical protein
VERENAFFKSSPVDEYHLPQMNSEKVFFGCSLNRTTLTADSSLFPSKDNDFQNGMQFFSKGDNFFYRYL